MFFSDWFYPVDLLSTFVWLAVLVLVVVTVTAVREAPDPGGRRLTAVFLVTVLGLSLVIGVVTSTAAVSDLAAVLQDDDRDADEYEEFEEEFVFEGDEPGREDNYANALQGALVAGAAAAVFAYHRRRLQDLLADVDLAEGAAGKVGEGYAHIASVIGLLALAGGGATAIYGVVKIAAPGVFSAEDVDLARDIAAGTTFVGAWLALLGVGIVALHRRRPGRVDADVSPAEPPVEEAPIP